MCAASSFTSACKLLVMTASSIALDNSHEQKMARPYARRRVEKEALDQLNNLSEEEPSALYLPLFPSM